MSNLSAMVDFAITSAEVAHGKKFVRSSRVPAAIHAGVKKYSKQAKALKWSLDEDQFLKDNLGYMSDAEIGRALNRSEIAVHLRWSRDLHLCSPSKHPNVITAQQASLMLAIDPHKIAHWVDIGLIPGRLMAGGRKIRLIQRVNFYTWCCDYKNWVYFDPKKVTDPHLTRLLRLAAKRWGDEWWTTRRAGDYHGVPSKTILMQIMFGRLPGSYHLKVSLGGRHPKMRWANWFVLRSEVEKLVIPRRKGVPGKLRTKFSPAADRWILKARDQLGMTFLEIGNSIKVGRRVTKIAETVRYRYKQLKATQIKSKKRSK